MSARSARHVARGGSLCSLALLPALFAGAPAALGAQTPERPETVMTRYRPELDPLGVRAGAFEIFPQLTLARVRDDNLFASDSATVSDDITRIDPAVRVRSTWSRHALNLVADANLARHARNGSEDYDDHRVALDGRVDLDRDDRLLARASRARLHEARTSPDDAGGATPTRYGTSGVVLGYRHRFNRLSAELRGALDWLDFDDVDSAGGVINNDDRDRREAGAALEVGYEFPSQRVVFVRASSDRRQYAERFDDDGVQRSSDGYSVLVGSSVRPTALLFGDVLLGYSRRAYDDPLLDPVGGVSGDGQLTWAASGLTTVGLSLRREIRETVIASASGVFSTRIGLRLDHELLRNLLLNARYSIARDDFRGLDRNDRYRGVTLGATYMMNRNFHLDLRYDHDRRASNATSGIDDFNRSRLAISIKAQI